MGNRKVFFKAIGQHIKGKHCYNNGRYNKYFSDDDVIPAGFVKGRGKDLQSEYDYDLTHDWTDDEIKAYYDAHSDDYENDDVSVEKEETPVRRPAKPRKDRRHWYNNGKCEKLFKSGSEPDGWKIGKVVKIDPSKARFNQFKKEIDDLIKNS